MAIGERRKLIFNIIAVSLLGIVTGLFIRGDLLPSQAAQQMYDKSTITNQTVTNVEHSHDGLPLHKHVVTTVATTTETTPHGYFHDFAAEAVSGMLPPPQVQQAPIVPEVTPEPALPPNQQVLPPVIYQTPTLRPKQGANEIWNWSDGFRPATLTVPVGTTVTWTNVDMWSHNVKSDDDLFDGTMIPGGSFSFTFTKTGIFSYHCEAHAGMAGTVYVK